MTLAESILNLLNEKPGLKAREIAGALNLSEKGDVNSVLYGALKGKVKQDASYRWWPVKTEAEGVTEKSVKNNTLLTRFCQYYLECLNQDDQGGVTLFASSKFDLAYTELDGFPLGGQNQFLFTAAVRKLVNKAKKDKNWQVLMLGYPTKLIYMKTAKWEGYQIAPLFLFPLIQEGSSVRMSNEFPEINFSALKGTGMDTENILEESLQLCEDLGLSDPNAEMPDMDELMARFKELRPDWQWNEPMDPNNLAKEPPLSKAEVPGIYNRAIVFMAEASNYTRGLEAELSKLQDVDESEYAGTALGLWLKTTQVESSPPPDKPLLEILQLNSEQRDAVRRSLSNPLTIITGPPGTGKSQVVSSILINAAWQGKRVIFASKNNKAVDVVDVRVNSLGPRPVLLRLGNSQYQARLASYLVSLLSAISRPSDEDEYKELLGQHQEICDSYAKLDTELEKTIDLRNQIDQYEKEIESLRAQISSDLFASFRDLDLTTMQKLLAKCYVAIDRSNPAKQNIFIKMFWAFLRQKRYEDLASAMQASQSIIERLGLQCQESIPNDRNIQSWVFLSDAIRARMHLAEPIKRYFGRLDELSSSRSPESIAEEKRKVVEKLCKTSGALWMVWLRLLPSRLSDKERDALREYASLLEMIVRADDEGQSIDRKLFKKYYQLLPRITNIVSCWAVTSLAAKGKIPLEPGFFDLVVIDEASQCDIASALPLLFRAKRAVIIGDPKQLRHICRMPARQDAALLSKYDLLDQHAKWGYSGNSLFDLASGICKTGDIVSLRDHHRSHSDIISFSNAQFYEGNLRIATDYRSLKRPFADGPAVRWIDVKGKVSRPAGGGAMNDIEARAVVAEIERLVLQQNYKGSIGVVSPFRGQANRIRDLATQNDALATRLNNDFLVDTVHKFQGDERDVMIFSPTISEGTSDGARAFLRCYPNLFNVAITRARAALIVIGDRMEALNSKVDYLSKFADHVSKINSQQKPNEYSEETILGPEYPMVARPELVSEWEKILYRKLFQHGIRAIPQYSVEKYLLDFAYINDGRRLNIEVDGEMYHRNWNGELRRVDQIRNHRLMELGWDVMRFWVYQIRDDMSGCIARVKQWINKK